MSAAIVLTLLASSALQLLNPTTTRPRTRSAIMTADDAAAVSTKPKPKITVRVKKTEEWTRDGEEPIAQVADDSSVTTSIKVNKPAVKTPAKPAGPKRTPEEELLVEAVQNANCTKIIEALQAGANPNVRDPKQRTPLHFASGVGLAPAAVLLIHYGAQLDLVDEQGLTAMHMAAGYANSQTLRVLVTAGANSTIAGKTQGTPREIVQQMGQYHYENVWLQRKDKWNRLKKTDPKLVRLKQCAYYLDYPEEVSEESPWDELLRETLAVTYGPGGEPKS